MKNLNELELWLFAGIASIIGQSARIGHELFVKSTTPPADASQYQIWRTKRKWVIIGELMALPFFPSVAALISIYGGWPQALCLGVSLGLGFVGLAFVLDITKFAVRKRLDMPQ